MTSVLDEIAPAFKAATVRWPDAPNIQAHYADLVSTFESNGSSLLELCKSFLEMVCITIIKELGKDLPDSSTPTTTEYLGCTLDALGIRNQRGSSALGTVISGYNKLSNGLSDIRNQEGSVGHGKDGFIDAISERHARVYLLTADSLINLLLQAYNGELPDLRTTREPCSSFSHLNERINNTSHIGAEIDEESNKLKIIIYNTGIEEPLELEVTSADILFDLYRDAYVEIVEGIKDKPVTEAEEEERLETEEAEKETAEEKPAQEVMEYEKSIFGKLQPLTQYDGIYIKHVSPLYDFILHSILGGEAKYAIQVQNLTYTLLKGMEDMAFVDWSSRPSTRAEVRVFVKKLIKLFSIEGIEDKAINEIVSWLAQRIEGGEE